MGISPFDLTHGEKGLYENVRESVSKSEKGSGKCLYNLGSVRAKESVVNP